MPLQAVWRLAAAYWYAGQRDVARNMVEGLSMPEGDYRELAGTFGSTLRDRAMVLETLILVGTGTNNQEILGRTRNLVEEISGALSSYRWLSTQETAYALIAMAPYMQNNASNNTLNLNYSMSGHTDTVAFNTPSSERFLGNVNGTTGYYSVTNHSDVPVYLRIMAKGLPDEGSEPALSEGITLTVQYRDSNGRTIDPRNLRLGEDMDISVRIRNSHSQALEEVAVIVPVPASWEIINTRLAGSDAEMIFNFQDIRDDRVMTYLNLARNEEKVITFSVNKTYEGNFFRPAIHAYAMYDESIRALIPGIRE